MKVGVHSGNRSYRASKYLISLDNAINSSAGCIYDFFGSLRNGLDNSRKFRKNIILKFNNAFGSLINEICHLNNFLSSLEHNGFHHSPLIPSSLLDNGNSSLKLIARMIAHQILSDLFVLCSQLDSGGIGDDSLCNSRHWFDFSGGNSRLSSDDADISYYTFSSGRVVNNLDGNRFSFLVCGENVINR